MGVPEAELTPKVRAALDRLLAEVQSLREDLDRMLDELAATVAGPVQGGIYVSCLARGPNLFREPGLEVSLIRQRFGEIPLAGFYANGEIAGQDLYGYTGVLTVFT